MQARHFGRKWTYAKQNVTSIDFMLEFIIDPIEPVHKKTKLPDIVKLNFPSKKTFSKNLKPQPVRDEHLLRFHPQVPDPVKVLPLLGHTGTDDGFRQCCRKFTVRLR